METIKIKCDICNEELFQYGDYWVLERTDPKCGRINRIDICLSCREKIFKCFKDYGYKYYDEQAENQK